MLSSHAQILLPLPLSNHKLFLAEDPDLNYVKGEENWHFSINHVYYFHVPIPTVSTHITTLSVFILRSPTMQKGLLSLGR